MVSKNIMPPSETERFDLAKHYSEVFGVFTYEIEQVTLEIDAKLLNAI